MRAPRVVVLLVMAAALATASVALAKPSLPMGKISSDASPQLKRALTDLYSPDSETRARAADAIRDLGPSAASAVPFLVSMLGDTSDSDGGAWSAVPGQSAAWALSSIGDPAVPALAAALGAKDPKVPARAIMALARIETPASTAALVTALRHRSRAVRREAAEALAERAQIDVIEGLLPLLADPDPAVRAEAAMALADDSDVRALDPTLRLL